MLLRGLWVKLTHDTKYERGSVELQSHFGDNPLKFQVVCPQIGTAVLKGLSLIFTNPPEDKKRNQVKNIQMNMNRTRPLSLQY